MSVLKRFKKTYGIIDPKHRHTLLKVGESISPPEGSTPIAHGQEITENDWIVVWNGEIFHMSYAWQEILAMFRTYKKSNNLSQMQIEGFNLVEPRVIRDMQEEPMPCYPTDGNIMYSDNLFEAFSAFLKMCETSYKVHQSLKGSEKHVLCIEL